MYLKSIEVHGFKSFANRLKFEFHDGITAIVGPNGSGKSNVSDAVRWVLGEQSARSLRGAKMEDVIFSGTELRKPLGFAYVAITLDNSDHSLPIAYEEVTVARRVYRSGESEYLINGSECRLRDVQELFLDTGVGKEGYSIIGQGQVEKILSGKPEDRREIFDEAAGITKFKKRKTAAERSLEAERLNLSRVGDILSEIEKQLAPLEKQSAVAKEYLKLRDELRRIEIRAFIQEYEASQENRKQLEEKAGIAAVSLQEIKEQYTGTKEEYERLETLLLENETVTEQLSVEIQNLKISREKLEGEIKVLQEQITAVRQSEAHYRERINVILTQQEKKKEEQRFICTEEEAVEKELSGLSLRQKETGVKQSETAAALQEAVGKAEQGKTRSFALLNQSTELRANIEHLESILEQNSIKKVTFHQRLLKSKSDESALQKEIGDYKASLTKTEAELMGQQEALQREEQAAAENSLRRRELQDKLQAKQQEAVRDQSRYDSIKNMAERYDGYGGSIRQVMEQRKTNPGIIGVVADILQVDKKFETAIETALGGSIQHIVTEEEETAKQMITYLKKNKLGRATFLPLTAMEHARSFSSKEALKEPGVIGLASGLVHTEQRFLGLVSNLLGRVVVVDHIDHAVSIAKKYQYTLRIVTIEGEQLSPGGSISGGAYRNSSSLLARRRELEELAEGLKRRRKELELLQSEMEAAAQLRLSSHEAVETLRRNIQGLSIDKNTAIMQMKQAGARLDELQLQYSEIVLENTLLEQNSNEVKIETEACREKLKKNEAEKAELDGTIGEWNSRIATLREKEQKEQQALEALRLNDTALEQRARYLSDNKERVSGEIKELELERSKLLRDCADTAAAVKMKEEQIRFAKLEADRFFTGISEKEQKREAQLEERKRTSETHRGFFEKREALAESSAALDKECFRLTAQKERLSEQLDQLISYMWDEYEVTYNQARTEHLSLETAPLTPKKEIAELKAKIREIGDVNVNAVEDYRSAKERFELLTNQREDILKAEEVLIHIIEELDEGMRRQFKEKFEEIRRQFDSVFKELFGGGKGSLELTEGEDLLVAGIRIIAQPPGKKLQNMMQLSGGEKALTAIALLFAIQNLRPSPFCLLDEIEAALDDSNVVRFAGYLHKLTKHTQFIVITHRRGTMSSADILYGITMQEKGISTLVSVSLIEDKLA